MTLRIGSLFSGIDGLSLGLERALDAETIWQCELDKHASTVLERHWPGVPNLGDITAVNWGGDATGSLAVDILCGGFP